MQRGGLLAVAILGIACHSQPSRQGRLSPQAQVDSDAAIVNRRRLSIPTVAIIGTVLDSSGRPAPRTTICIGRCAQVDSTGHYVIDRVLRGKYRVGISCTRRRRSIQPLSLLDDSLNLADAGAHQIDWRVSTTGCDGRPIIRRTGEWRGYFTSGFEESGFVPCRSDRWTLPSDSIAANAGVGAWVEMPERVWRRIHWPTVPEVQAGYPRYYVRWRGAVVGPGIYGHGGISDFLLAVDKVFEIRAPRPGDCAQ